MSFKLSCDQCPTTNFEKESMLSFPYSNAMGYVMYSMICTRPNLSYVVSVLSRFMENYDKLHWQAMKWLHSYLKYTVDDGLL